MKANRFKTQTANSICMFPFSKTVTTRFDTKHHLSFWAYLSAIVYTCIWLLWIVCILVSVIRYENSNHHLNVAFECVWYVLFRLHLYWWTGCTLHINWIEFVLYLLLFPSYCSRHRRESKMQMSLSMLQEKLDSHTRHHRKIEKTASKYSRFDVFVSILFHF